MADGLTPGDGRPSEGPLDDGEALELAGATGRAAEDLMRRAAKRRDRLFGRTLTYSPKVFLPLTNLCRNRCDYCAFRRSAGDPGEHTMSHDEVRSTLARARDLGCVEALFCLGDQPESAFPTYRRKLETWGHDSTVDYLYWAAQRALDVGLLPHTNAGILTQEEMRRLAGVNVSLGLMLENTSPRLCERGMPHHRAPDKRPHRRLEMIDGAGRERIAFTTGLLVGIGETPEERIETLLAIRDAHRTHRHVQEVIVQNFTPHDGTLMADAPEPTTEVLAVTIALARLVLDSDVSVQSPPNLNAGRTQMLIDAGINDFGGISPLTPDYINPGRPWPYVAELSQQCAARGYALRPRLPIYDAFAARPGYLRPGLVTPTQAARRRLAESPAKVDARATAEVGP